MKLTKDSCSCFKLIIASEKSKNKVKSDSSNIKEEEKKANKYTSKAGKLIHASFYIESPDIDELNTLKSLPFNTLQFNQYPNIVNLFAITNFINVKNSFY
jgi:hypothetical protein